MIHRIYFFDRKIKNKNIFILENKKRSKIQKTKKEGRNEGKEKRYRTRNYESVERLPRVSVSIDITSLTPDKRYIMRVIISATVLFDPEGPVFSTGILILHFKLHTWIETVFNEGREESISSIRRETRERTQWSEHRRLSSN